MVHEANRSIIFLAFPFCAFNARLMSFLWIVGPVMPHALAFVIYTVITVTTLIIFIMILLKFFSFLFVRCMKRKA